MNTNKPILVGRYWHMPDGGLVPHIAGGSSGDGDGNKDDTMTSEDAAKLKADLKAARSEAASSRVALRDMKEQLGDIDPSTIAGLVSDADKRKQDTLTAQGKFDEAKSEIERRHATQVESLNGKIKQLEGRLSTVLIDNEIVSAASSKDAVSAPQIATLLRPNIRLSDAGAVEVVGADGKVSLAEDGKPVSVSSYVSKFMEDNPHFVKASGGGAGSTGATGSKGSAEVHGQSRIQRGLAARNK